MIDSSNYHHGNLREQILKTAFKLLDDEGIEAVGVRKIARQLNVAHSAPANHFKNKQALLTSMATESFLHLVSTIHNAISQDTTQLSTAIHAFSAAIVSFALAYPNRYKLLWRREYADNTTDELNAAMKAIYSQLTDILKKYVQRKEVDIESQAIALWSLIHGYVLLRLDGNLTEGVDEITGIKRQEAIIDVLITGITH